MRTFHGLRMENTTLSPMDSIVFTLTTQRTRSSLSIITTAQRKAEASSTGELTSRLNWKNWRCKYEKSTPTRNGFRNSTPQMPLWSHHSVPVDNDTSELQKFQFFLVTDDLMSFFIANYERTGRLSAANSKSAAIQSVYKDEENSEFYFSGSVTTTNCGTPGRWIFRVDGVGSTKGPGISPRNFVFTSVLTIKKIEVIELYLASALAS